MSIISYSLEEILFTFTALGAIYTVDFFCALTTVAAVAAVLVALLAFTAGGVAAVAGGSCYISTVTALCAIAGGVTAVQQWRVYATLTGPGAARTLSWLPSSQLVTRVL